MHDATLTQQQVFPLPRSDFLYDRLGPWPQPAPDHPMAMAAEVLHPAPAEVRDWDFTAGWNYVRALITKFPLAVYNGLVHRQLDHLDDAQFVEIATTTTYSKYLRVITNDELAASPFAGCLAPFDPTHQFLTMDFTPMQDLSPFPGVYVAPTITLFERDHAKATCRARAIFIGHLTGDRWKHTVLTPADVNAWTLARYFVLQGGAHMVVLSGHPATHFPYDTVNAVTQSAVPMRHTLFKLLKPHLRLQLAVDNAVLEGGNSVVSETRGTFYAPFAGPSANIRQLVAAGYLGYPNVLSKFAPGDAPGLAYPRWAYPMAPKAIPSDFGRYLEAYFNTVKDYVREVVAHIVENADTRQGQEELYYIRRWARYIAGWLPGFPDDAQILNPDENGDPLLVGVLTTFIWDVSIAHSLEHRSFGNLGPHRVPFRVRVPPPDSPDAPAYKRSEILDGWDIFRSTLGFEMFFKPHNIQLLKDIDYAFDSETLRASAQAFQAALQATEARLIAEGVKVEHYAPLAEIACSIQY